MTSAELRDHCRKQIEIIGSDDAHVMLTLPGRWSSDTKRLAGRSGPRGRCVADVERNGRPSVLVDFKARDILAWLDSLPREEVRGG